ncbi:hypothetical protein PYW08_001416 [Mythimna loreyi]|uniref:Uncharacterized protein n=1 Tax=Mythimna loreyi TaxID=667449 RepID=A0ACC2R878_9NEOP|nr:hypothetical protein PYW08_001416 [Mythimna loreyi]
MYLLVLLTVFGVAFAVPLTAPSTKIFSALTEEERAAAYVLPSDTIPTFYDVRLTLNPDNEEYFTGAVDIRILPLIITNQITLHAKAMNISAADIEVYAESAPTVNLFQSHTLATNDTHLFRITLNRNMTVLQPHTIRIKHYVGHYGENLHGIYISTYTFGGTKQKLITSHLEPTNARSVFPCYDEPALKAIFRTTIYSPPAYSAVRSNMPMRAQPLKPEIPGYAKHEFDDTLVMSTYLLAYLVSNLDYVDNAMDTPYKDLYRLPFRVYSRPDTQNAAMFALEFGQKSMIELEKYTEFDYKFPKLDMAAVPDFAAAAMENWGLIIYREIALLVAEGVTTTEDKQLVGQTISHENTHQWFGNEVGPLSWTHTWLNEGFAQFFMFFATDMVIPEWRMMDQFVLDIQKAFHIDAELSVNPMNNPVYTPAEIKRNFNEVAYQKSGAVIRMMQNFLTPEVFRKGLVIYIRNNSRSAASPLNLYASLQEALDASNHSIPYPLCDVMNLWTNQAGFPVLTVTRNADQSIVIEQARYLTNNTERSNNRWHVPINWVLSTNPDFSDTRPQHWVPPSFPARPFDIPGLSNASWYIINKQQTGYYRVNYDVQNWAALATALNNNHEVIHVLNRAQLIDDAFDLARNGRLSYKYARRIANYLVKEKDYIPWAAANRAFKYLEKVPSSSTRYNLCQDYLLNLTAPLYKELGFDAADDEEPLTPLLRNIILDLNCRHGNPDCITKAEKKLKAFRANPKQRLNPDIQTLVYCTSLRGGSAENFNFLWDMFLASQDSSEQSILLNAMGCTSNEERRTFFLNQTISDTSPVRKQDRLIIIDSVSNAGFNNEKAAEDFVTKHLDEIKRRLQQNDTTKGPKIYPSSQKVRGLTGTTNILNASTRRLTSEAHYQKIDEFFDLHQGIYTA